MVTVEPGVVLEVAPPEPGPKIVEAPPGAVFGEGTVWWTDHGPPGTIVGSKPGDKYIDMDTGDVYTLGD